MALPLRPFLSVVSSTPLASTASATLFLQRRSFSQYPPRWASVRGIEGAISSQSLGRNVKSLLNSSGQVPEDVGLLPQTFINPTRRNIPSILRAPRTYISFRTTHLRTRLRDLFHLLVFKWSSPKTTSFFRRRIQLRRSQIVPAALALHRDMYSAFAEGDIAALRKLCTDGLYNSFVARIKARPRGEEWRWEMVRYHRVGMIMGGGGRLVSCRAARIGEDGTGVVQAVVRIKSRQRLTRFRPDGTIAEGSGKEKDVEELVVVQKFVRGWEEGVWRVWGLVGETTVDDLRRWKEQAA